MKCFVHSRVWRHLRWVQGFVALWDLARAPWGFVRPFLHGVGGGGVRFWRGVSFGAFGAAGGACGLCLGSGARCGRAPPSGVCPAGGLRRRFACGFGFGHNLALLFVAVLLVSWD